jgi:phenylpyruvate tautomerase PptA (4-oxalocrotonate tautomerase family)
MPFVQFHLPAKFTESVKKKISLSVHESLVDIFNVPRDDYFQVIHPVVPGHMIYPGSYLGIPHSDNLTYIYITCGIGRTVAMKQKLYASIAEKIASRTPISKDDVIIMLNEIAWENWSFGQGIAQMVK